MMTKNQLNLPLLDNEYWWGGLINSPYRQPFSAGMRVNLEDMRGNCANPVLISNQGRYIWSEEPFEFSLTKNNLTVTSNDPQGEVVWGEGYENLRSAYLAVSKRYFPPSGKMPSEGFFTSPQYNTWIEMNYRSSQERVLEYAAGILENGFPPGILIIDTLWSATYGPWRFDGARYPDPKGMVEQLNQMGFDVMLWVVPYITADTILFRKLRDQGFLFADTDGSPKILQWWDGFSAALDVTNPAAVDWLHQHLGYLVSELGIAGFKLDGGQPVQYHRMGVDRPHEATRAWNHIGLKYPFAEYKDSWKSAGLPLAQRIRDRDPSWEARRGLGSLIPMGLEQSLLGYTFNCPDMIGGGEIQCFPENGNWDIDEELFVRYAQASALFPMMQFSAAPWRLLSKENSALCRGAAILHTQLAPEILALTEESAQTGEPIMRHLEYVYPHQGYEKVNDQFLLGNDILVTPVVQKGQTHRPIIFPPGTWEGDDGSYVKGPQTLEVETPLSRLPWYRRLP